MIRTQKDQYQQFIGLKFNQGQQTLTAFLTNFKTRTYIDIQQSQQRMALLCYFQDQNGEVFKCYYPFNPYFYVGFQSKSQTEVRMFIEGKVPKILHMQTVQKVDLQQINHLSGRKRKYLKLSFRTIGDLTNARKFLDIRKKKINNNDTQLYMNPKKSYTQNPKDLITDIRQYDVPYHSRVCIDTGIRAGKWFQIKIKDKFILQLKNSKKQSFPDLKVLAFDIQTSKDPFKFPQKQKDIVMMISIMFEGQGVLIINSGFCTQKVSQFDYQPQGKQQFKCHVVVYNMPSQKQTLEMFIDIIKNYKPTVITSFNGDKFDYPFIQARCQYNGIQFYKGMGVANKNNSQYFGSFISHLDCYYWVDRDAYLPQGSRGLKAVTRAKLKYQPIQVDPQKMVQMGRYQTSKLAQYAISDAVATFYLYMKHIHGFIYALSTIIPMMPDQVLRKGSGTLCENLLMAQAYARNIIFPNKQIENFQKFYRGHLLDTETYTGGKVQCLRSGIYRADFPTDFTLNPKAFQNLIDSLQQIIQFTVKNQQKQHISNIDNLSQVKSTIISSLQKLRDVSNPLKYQSLPLIYHIDVAAMYPNIIITNRLQPVAVVNDQICSGCLFNSPQYDCKRNLQWQWRGQYFPLNQGQYALIKQQQTLKIDGNYNKLQYEKNIKNQVKKYCQKIYRKAHIQISQVRKDTVCMRQNSFYVDTVRAFRDRRYEYKGLTKQHKIRANQKSKQKDFEGQKQQIKLMQLYQSMQLAHKIILNSFYGYVMRKGSRWYSMQTAAMVTYIGSNIINDSKNFIQARLGKPLQLDTDGIWMLLPQGFPQDVKIKFKNGKSMNMSYPCQILNHLIYEKYANPQYQQLQNQQNFEYKITKQMTIAFQIDGPYKAMFIPGGKDKKKTTQLDIQQHSTQMLKKRYVVFNHKNQVSQFKGLEMKRRGQLNIIKMFQSQIFGQYVKGKTLKQCYAFCAEVAMKYFNLLLNKGQSLDIQAILQRLEESKNLSKDVVDYGESKGVAISAAKRLADYLGPQVAKGKNLCLYYIISAYPPKRPVTQRAIPTQIFFADEETQKKYLYKWTKHDKLKTHVDIRDILDWDYYKQRLSTQIQKMVCIPAVMQNLSNPIPQIQLPDWLQKKTFDMRFHRQQKISAFGFGKITQILTQTQRKHNTSHKKTNQLKDTQQIQPKLLFDESNKKTFLRKSHKNQYSIKTQFKSWLTQQKKIWRDHKRQIAINQSLKFHQLKSVLQIIPIQNSPGSFTIWFYSGNKIQQLLLHFKRHYYTKDKKKGLKKGPRDQGPAMEIIVDQTQFIKTQQLYQSVFGRTFYQTKMPLIISLILKKGNLWKISKHLPLYRQQDIHQVFGSQYLPKIQDNFMPTVYLSQINAQNLKNKHVFLIFSPKTNQYTFVYLDNSLGKNNDELLRLARKTIQKQDAKILIKVKHTEKQVGKQINEGLKNLQKTLKQTFLVILQSTCQISYLRSIGVQCLQQQFPILKFKGIQVQKADSLDWKKTLLKKSLQQSLIVDKKIIDILQWSRFTHIPLCNFSQNSQNLLDYITNITYSRLLHSGDYITWWNNYNSQIIETYQSKTQTGRIINSGLYTSYCIEIQIDNLAVNTIANSDQLIYQDRDIAMMLQKNGNKKYDGKKQVNLFTNNFNTINTINNNNNNTINNNLVPVNSTNNSYNPNNKIQFLDEMNQAKKAFDYLRKMIKGWIQDLNINLQKANDLLRNFHKWITTHSNALYDPLLFRMVNQLMKKMFSILIKKINNLGMNIIYASFSKIIVATEKHSYKQAQNTINYILTKCTNQNQKLFGYLVLRPIQNYYQVLLYKDPLNFVGILITQQEGKKQMNKSILYNNNNENIQNNQQQIQKNIQYSFEMAKLFNPIARILFQQLILKFVDTLSQIKKSLIQQYSQNKMKLMLNYENLINERTIKYIQQQFSQQVLYAIQRIIYQWQQQKQNQKKLQNTNINDQLSQQQENNNQDQQQQQQDSFIVDDDQQISQDMDIESLQDGTRTKKVENLNSNKKQQNRRKKKKLKNKNKNKTIIDFNIWGSDKQLDMLIQTLFQLLNYNQSYYQVFDILRRRAFQKIHQQSTYTHRFIKPQYPQFQLPCSNCYLVNDKPGLCQHCHIHLNVQTQLENSIWKMMQQQGRDLYCNRCNNIMQGFLRKCGCGGTWDLGEKPLEWLPYMGREDSVWKYCNDVFQFMGIN